MHMNRIFIYIVVTTVFSHWFPVATSDQCGRCDNDQDGSNCMGPCNSVTTTLMIKHLINFIRELSEVADKGPCPVTPKPGTDHTTTKPKTTKKPTLATMYPSGSTTKKPTRVTKTTTTTEEPTTTTEEPPTTTDGTVVVPCIKGSVDVVILIDASGSMGPQNFTIAKTFAANLSSSFRRAGKNRVGVINYSTWPTVYFPIVNIFSADDLHDGVMDIKYDAGWTFIGRAMQQGLYEWVQYRIPPGTISKNMIVITDGESQDNIRAPSDQAKAAGVTTFAIGIGDKLKPAQLLVIAGGNSSRVFQTEFENLNKILRAVTTNICQ